MALLIEIFRTFYCSIFMVLIMIFLLMLQTEWKQQMDMRKPFAILLAVTVAFFGFDQLSSVVKAIPDSNRQSQVIDSIKYALKPALLYMVLRISERDRSELFRRLLMIPLLLEIAVLIIGFTGRLVFSIDTEMNLFHEGPLHAVTWLVLLVYMALIICSAIVSHVSRQECLFLLLALGFISCNIVIERVLMSSIPGMEHAVIMFGILMYYTYFVLRANVIQSLVQEKEISRARMQAMISQIKPHFIYNSLACIAELCHEGAPKGEEAVLMFSAYLRDCFSSLTEDGLIPFADELKTIQHYVELERLQAPDRFRVVYDIQETGFSVPVLSVQTLVENAVKHGIRKKHGAGTVTLKTARARNGIVITVTDDGVGFDTKAQLPDGQHLGLKNAAMRFSEQCDASLQVKSRVGEGTEVTILLPEGKRI